MNILKQNRNAIGDSMSKKINERYERGDRTRQLKTNYKRHCKTGKTIKRKAQVYKTHYKKQRQRKTYPSKNRGGPRCSRQINRSGSKCGIRRIANFFSVNPW